MGCLTSKDFKDVLHLIHLSQSSREINALRQELLQEMDNVFRFHSANFFLSKDDQKKIDIANVLSFGIEKRYIDQYNEYYYLQDFFRSTFDSRKAVATTEDILLYSDLVNLEYYNDFLLPQKIHHELAVYLRSGSSFLGVIALFRPKNSPNFTNREIQKAKLLAPHLSKSLETILLLERLDREQGLWGTACNLFPWGILVLDSQFRLINWNLKAKKICLSLSQNTIAQCRGSPEESYLIPPQVLEECSLLKELSQRENPFEALKRCRIVPVSSTERIQIKINLIKESFKEYKTPFFLVILENLSEILEGRERNLKEKYNLTGREIEIIRVVSEGFSNKEIAERLFISSYTVENHLKNIFEKIGVKNRTSLIHKLI